ncbi:hypothetical protein ADUPG1_012147 [Aduncisulcus paluster]|uniref:Uncharacterized protein n=1 Tax=Aduncisulcus paluster TaxID=2918883 RepID=A0ABQ5JYI0_9EUKA|nr:hypothetical protein ADUPG1_012147 [Aduncisulcus paluster]
MASSKSDGKLKSLKVSIIIIDSIAGLPVPTTYNEVTETIYVGKEILTHSEINEGETDLFHLTSSQFDALTSSSGGSISTKSSGSDEICDTLHTHNNQEYVPEDNFGNIVLERRQDGENYGSFPLTNLLDPDNNVIESHGLVYLKDSDNDVLSIMSKSFVSSDAPETDSTTYSLLSSDSDTHIPSSILLNHSKLVDLAPADDDVDFTDLTHLNDISFSQLTGNTDLNDVDGVHHHDSTYLKRDNLFNTSEASSDNPDSDSGIFIVSGSDTTQTQTSAIPKHAVGRIVSFDSSGEVSISIPDSLSSLDANSKNLLYYACLEQQQRDLFGISSLSSTSICGYDDGSSWYDDSSLHISTLRVLIESCTIGTDQVTYECVYLSLGGIIPDSSSVGKIPMSYYDSDLVLTNIMVEFDSTNGILTSTDSMPTQVVLFSSNVVGGYDITPFPLPTLDLITSSSSSALDIDQTLPDNDRASLRAPITMLNSAGMKIAVSRYSNQSSSSESDGTYSYILYAPLFMPLTQGLLVSESDIMHLLDIQLDDNGRVHSLYAANDSDCIVHSIHSVTISAWTPLQIELFGSCSTVKSSSVLESFIPVDSSTTLYSILVTHGSILPSDMPYSDLSMSTVSMLLTSRFTMIFFAPSDGTDITIYRRRICFSPQTTECVGDRSWQHVGTITIPLNTDTTVAELNAIDSSHIYNPTGDSIVLLLAATDGYIVLYSFVDDETEFDDGSDGNEDEDDGTSNIESTSLSYSLIYSDLEFGIKYPIDITCSISHKEAIVTFYNNDSNVYISVVNGNSSAEYESSNYITFSTLENIGNPGVDFKNIMISNPTDAYISSAIVGDLWSIVFAGINSSNNEVRTFYYNSNGISDYDFDDTACLTSLDTSLSSIIDTQSELLNEELIDPLIFHPSSDIFNSNPNYLDGGLLFVSDTLAEGSGCIVLSSTPNSEMQVCAELSSEENFTAFSVILITQGCENDSGCVSNGRLYSENETKVEDLSSDGATIDLTQSEYANNQKHTFFSQPFYVTKRVNACFTIKQNDNSETEVVLKRIIGFSL